VRGQAFVREASSEDELILLYVDQGDTAVPQLIRVLDGAGLRANTISLARPSLDDVFLRQTGRSLRDEPAA
jgi:ABC-2 type transport system ATP-binding protein